MNAQLRMRDLVEKTGTSREAIRFYISAGLLPEPRKTSRNMAWYSPEHVERIRYIKALQEEHFLPLKEIRSVLDGKASAKFTAHQHHQFEVLRQRLRTEHAAEVPTDLAQLVAELGLSAEDSQAVAKLGFVDDAGRVSADGAELLRLWAQLRGEGLTPERGFTPADMAIVNDAVDLLFAHELNMFTQRLGDMDDDELGHILDRILPAINRIFALLHERRLKQFLDREMEDKT